MADTLTGFPDFFRYAVFQLLNTCGGSVGSGSRTNEEQASLYASKGPWSPNNPGAAAPGTSNHEVGVGSGAADMEGDLDCMHANAARFGLEFPMANEPWHIEPSKELIAQGMAFFGLEPGMDPNAARPEPEDPMERVAAILMGEVDNDDLTGEQPLPTKTGNITNPMPGELNLPAIPTYAEPGKGGLDTFGKGSTTGYSKGGGPVKSKAEGTFVPQASAGFASSPNGPVSPQEAAVWLSMAGFQGEALVTAVAIAMGESGLDPGATGDTSLTNATWGPSLGLMQIRSVNAERGQGTWRDGSRLYDPVFNAKAAFAISNGGTDFSPWTVYTKGIYQQNLDTARAAVAAIGSGIGMSRELPPEQPAESQQLDDLLSASRPEDLFEGMGTGDLTSETIASEVRPTLEKESYAGA